MTATTNNIILTTERAERIARSLDAVNQPETLKLTPEEWKYFAEEMPDEGEEEDE